MRGNWEGFYTEFANVLLKFKDNRLLLLDKLRNAYKKGNLKFPRIEIDEPTDVDPFTVYGFFTKNLTYKNRSIILELLKKEFDVKANVPTDFSGIPTLNNQNVVFYALKSSKNRKTDDLENLWVLFDLALKLEASDNIENRNAFIKQYDKVIKQCNIGYNITMGLYWVRPQFYINLDSRNRWYTLLYIDLPKDIESLITNAVKKEINGTEYLKIRDYFSNILKEDNSRYKNFIELSEEAFTMSDKVNKESKHIVDKPNSLIDYDDKHTIHYWIFSAGEQSCMFDEFVSENIIAVNLPFCQDLTLYPKRSSLQDEFLKAYRDDSAHTNDSLMAWQFGTVLKKNDIVFVKKGRNKVIGRCVITGDYYYDDNKSSYNHIHPVKWTHKAEHEHPGEAVTKTLTDITQYTEYVKKLENLYGMDVKTYNTSVNESYDKSRFLKEVFISSSEYDTMVNLLKHKKNLIIEGAPGVGKTYVANRLAYSMLGEVKKENVMMIQFHQSYSYEDFIMGYKPDGKEFVLKTGVFYDFCKKAQDDIENSYFFIIDEINRGNLSKIFGELFMLLESDKRGYQLQLLYSNEKFSIPKNVYIIGTMNTADRSLSLLDYALRRRFSFYDLKPAFNNDNFKSYQKGLDFKPLDNLLSVINSLNDVIRNDSSLGEGFCIGHSYFSNIKKENISNELLKEIVEYEIIPLLKEYWFDDPLKVKEWSTNLRSVIK